VHDLVKLLFEFVHHCDLTFPDFLFLTPDGAKPKQKARTTFSLPKTVQKSFSLYAGQIPTDNKSAHNTQIKQSTALQAQSTKITTCVGANCTAGHINHLQ